MPPSFYIFSPKFEKGQYNLIKIKIAVKPKRAKKRDF